MKKISFIKWIFLKLQLIPKHIKQILKFLTTATGEMLFGMASSLFSLAFLLPLFFSSSPLWLIIPSVLLLIGLHGWYRDEIEGDF